MHYSLVTLLQTSTTYAGHLAPYSDATQSHAAVLPRRTESGFRGLAGTAVVPDVSGQEFAMEIVSTWEDAHIMQVAVRLIAPHSRPDIR